MYITINEVTNKDTYSVHNIEIHEDEFRKYDNDFFKLIDALSLEYPDFSFENSWIGV